MDTLDGIIQLTITFFGVFLGFELSKMWDKSRHENQQREIKKNTIESLLVEFNVNELILKKPISPVLVQNVTDQFNPHTLLTGAFDTAISSGNFYLIESNLQKDLQLFYSKIKELRLLSELMFSLITPDLLSQGTNYQPQVKQAQDTLLKTAELNKSASLTLLETIRKNLIQESDKPKEKRSWLDSLALILLIPGFILAGFSSIVLFHNSQITNMCMVYTLKQMDLPNCLKSIPSDNILMIMNVIGFGILTMSSIIALRKKPKS